MTSLSKCLLFPIDGTEEALRPIEFLQRLYPNRDRIGLVLCYFAQALPPAFREQRGSQEQLKKKQELLKSREQAIRSAFEGAKKVLVAKGFQSDLIHEHVLEKQASKAKDACLLADWKKADAVLIRKRVTTTLAGLFEDDPTDALLRHCLTSPLWLVEGTTDVSQAAICITDEEASLRAADHAAFMLTGTHTTVTLLHAARNISQPLHSDAATVSSELERWFATPEGRPVKPFLKESYEHLKREGILDGSIRFAIIPSQGKAAFEILDYCRRQGIGILVLGHTPPTGITGFLKGSVTKKAIAELRNMTLWINQ